MDASCVMRCITWCFVCFEVSYMGASCVTCMRCHTWCFVCFEVSYMGACCVMGCNTWVLLGFRHVHHFVGKKLRSAYLYILDTCNSNDSNEYR